LPATFVAQKIVRSYYNFNKNSKKQR